MLLEGYKYNDMHHYLYTKRVEDVSLIVLILYADHMLLVGSNISNLDKLK